MNKHTPGPWFQGTDHHTNCVYDKRVWFESDGSRHGETPNIVITVSPKDAVADARLIAAAPELLEALQNALPYLRTVVPSPRNGINADCTTDLNCVARAEAAISKVTGEA